MRESQWEATNLEEAQLALAHVVGHPRLRDALDEVPPSGAEFDPRAALLESGIVLPQNAKVEFTRPVAESDSPHWDICVTVIGPSGHAHVWCVTVQPPIVVESATI